MTRAAYNITADVFTGPGALTPNSFRFTVACRLVDNQHQLTQRPDGMRFDFYANYSGVLTSAGDASLVGGVLTLDFNTADVWEIPAGSGQIYTVARTCLIRTTRPANPPYRRVYFLA